MAVSAGYVPQVGERDTDKIIRSVRNLYENAASPLRRTYNVETFGASESASDVVNAAAINNAIAQCQQDGGGQVLFPGYYKSTTITVTGNDVYLVGMNQSCGVYTNTAGQQLVKFSGVSRCGMKDFIVNYPVFTSSSTDAALYLHNCVGFHMDRCKIQGGYNCILIDAGSTADNTFVRCEFTYATGKAMVYIVDSTNGVNGAHHFWRCRFNQSYVVALGKGSSHSHFKANWVAGTTYVAGDVVPIGNYYLQCRVGGTSGGSAPSVNVWYGVDIVDGSVTWQLLAHTNYTGLTFDTNVNYSSATLCDFTSPFLYGVYFANSLAGTKPYEIVISDCFSHGPTQMGCYVEKADEITIRRFNTINATNNLATTYGIFVGSNSGRVTIEAPKIFGFSEGIALQAGYSTVCGGGSVVGNTTGIHAYAITGFNINGVNVGTSMGQANSTGITVDVGADRYSIIGNIVYGATTGVSDGGGPNKDVYGNR